MVRDRFGCRSWQLASALRSRRSPVLSHPSSGWGYSIAVIAAVNSVVAFVYYAKVVKTTFFDPVPETVDASRVLDVAPTLKLALALTAATVIVFGIFPGLITELVDLTTEDVRPLGLRVTRAVVPGFHPLVLGHRRRALGGRRLWEVPGKLGYPGRSPEQGDNPLPHPYP